MANKVILIDPSKPQLYDKNFLGETIKQEELVMYANLTATILPRSGAIENANQVRIANIEGRVINALKPNSEIDYFSTRWTNQENKNDPEFFGIKSISVKIDSSNIPKVDISFTDIRGNALFEQNAKSPYNAFTRLPYPVFNLELKGFYGKSQSLLLALTKMNSRFDSSTGNFEINTNFIGYNYGILTDTSLMFALIVPFMFKEGDTTKGQKIINSIYEKQIKSLNLKTNSNYIIPNSNGNYFSLHDLVMKTKNVQNFINTKNLDQEQIKGIVEIRDFITQTYTLKDELSKNVNNKIDTELSLIINSYNNRQSQLTLGDIGLKVINGNIGENVGEQITILTNNINLLTNKFQDIKDNLARQNTENITQQLGFKPTIFTTFQIIANSVQAFYELLLEYTQKANEHIKKGYRKITIANDCFLETELKYPWPVYYLEKENDGQPQKVSVYPGEDIKLNSKEIMPEVEFVEEFIRARAELIKLLNESTTSNDISNKPSFDVFTTNVFQYPTTENPYLLNNDIYSVLNPFSNIKNVKDLFKYINNRMEVILGRTYSNKINDVDKFPKQDAYMLYKHIIDSKNVLLYDYLKNNKENLTNFNNFNNFKNQTKDNDDDLLRKTLKTHYVITPNDNFIVNNTQINFTDNDTTGNLDDLYNIIFGKNGLNVDKFELDVLKTSGYTIDYNTFTLKYIVKETSPFIQAEYKNKEDENDVNVFDIISQTRYFSDSVGLFSLTNNVSENIKNITAVLLASGKINFKYETYNNSINSILKLNTRELLRIGASNYLDTNWRVKELVKRTGNMNFKTNVNNTTIEIKGKLYSEDFFGDANPLYREVKSEVVKYLNNLKFIETDLTAEQKLISDVKSVVDILKLPKKYDDNKFIGENIFKLLNPLQYNNSKYLQLFNNNKLKPLIYDKYRNIYNLMRYFGYIDFDNSLKTETFYLKQDENDGFKQNAKKLLENDSFTEETKDEFRKKILEGDFVFIEDESGNKLNYFYSFVWDCFVNVDRFTLKNNTNEHKGFLEDIINKINENVKIIKELKNSNIDNPEKLITIANSKFLEFVNNTDNLKKLFDGSFIVNNASNFLLKSNKNFRSGKPRVPVNSDFVFDYQAIKNSPKNNLFDTLYNNYNDISFIYVPYGSVLGSITDTNKNLYLERFFRTLSFLTKDKTIEASLKSTENEITKNLLIGNANEIRLSLYNTFKNIKDKWLTTSFKQQNGEYVYSFMYSTVNELNQGFNIDTKSLFEHFKFIDRANRPIGDIAVINLLPLSSFYNSENADTSIYSIISTILGKNKWNFLPLLNNLEFFGQTDKDVVSEQKAYEELFGLNTTLEKVSYSPAFLCQYVGGFSSFLDLNAINEDIANNPCSEPGSSNNIKTPNNKAGIIDHYDANLEGSKIVSFVVNYGDQNQNMFKSIQLDQSDFKETNESLKVINDLSSVDGGTKGEFVGGNLFEIYTRRSYKATIECMGNFMIQPTMYFYLQNIPLFRGYYLITNVSHNITVGDFTTTFEGVRVPLYRLPLIKDIAMFIQRDFVDSLINFDNLEVSENTTTEPKDTVIVKGDPKIETILNNAGYKKGTLVYEFALFQTTKEGWNPKANNGIGTSSYRNNNPGNLDFSKNLKTIDPDTTLESNPFGKKNRFAVFSSAENGMKALIELKIKKWANGGLPKTAANQSFWFKDIKPTIEQYMITYAPPTENSTTNYIDFMVNNLRKKLNDNTITKDTKMIDLLEKYK